MSERWFVIRTSEDTFSIGSENGIITFAPDHLKELIGKELTCMSSIVKNGNGKALELFENPKEYSLDTFFQIGKTKKNV